MVEKVQKPKRIKKIKQNFDTIRDMKLTIYTAKKILIRDTVNNKEWFHIFSIPVNIYGNKPKTKIKDKEGNYYLIQQIVDTEKDLVYEVKPI